MWILTNFLDFSPIFNQFSPTDVNFDQFLKVLSTNFLNFARLKLNYFKICNMNFVEEIAGYNLVIFNEILAIWIKLISSIQVDVNRVAGFPPFCQLVPFVCRFILQNGQNEDECWKMRKLQFYLLDNWIIFYDRAVSIGWISAWQWRILGWQLSPLFAYMSTD